MHIDPQAAPSREQLLHMLYEAAELEHNLMCTYLYAAFSLKQGEAEGLSAVEAEAVARWRREIIEVSVDEMGHLTAVWNITSALGGAPRFGRGNFPLDPGALPASVVVKLTPFGEAALQHFIHLERPAESSEAEGDGFAPDAIYRRNVQRPRITPMPIDYDTVGAFYETLSQNLQAFVAKVGEAAAFCGDPALQISNAEIARPWAKTVICAKTALAAFKAIVDQGEGASEDMTGSHFQRFKAIRTELRALLAANPKFAPAFPVAENPVLRRPVRSGHRVWIEDEEAASTVDIANTGYALMLRLLAYSYAVPRPSPEKALAVDLAMGLMRAVTVLAEHAARLPAGPSNPNCNAGMSFSALRDAASLPPGASAHRFFEERLRELSDAATALTKNGTVRCTMAARQLSDLAERAVRGFSAAAAAPKAAAAPAPSPQKASEPERQVANGIEVIEGEKLTIIYEGKKCIHSRFCVTEAPTVFLANVPGAWIYPDTMDVDDLVAVANECPSGAIRYKRKDGKHEETPPPVNLISVREAGPYAVRADILLAGKSAHYRATLCRCGASKNKPFCDGSHHDIKFAATGEPPTAQMDMLPVRNGPLAIEPETDGPLQVRGNMEILSGTGRGVMRTTNARLCRCGGSNTKPFCDGTHAKIGFKST